MSRPTGRSAADLLAVLPAVLLALAPCGALAQGFMDDMRCPDPRTGTERVYDTRVAPADDEPIHIESEAAEGGPARDWTLHGDVTITQGERRIVTRDAAYDAERGRISAPGEVEYTDPQIRLRGRNAQYQADGGAQFADAQVYLPARQARGAARHIALQPEGDVDLHDMSYTTCPFGNDDWLIRASHLHIDRRASTATARNVRLDFKGIPILYTPIISFPVGNERKSGLLFPDIGTSSSSGAELSAPWYWNMAPNYDATLTPSWYSLRGAKLDTEFRYLTRRAEGLLYAQYLPRDRRFGASRSFVQISDRTDLAPGLRLRLEGSNVSDDRWFEDFGRGPESTSVLYLGRLAELTYMRPDWNVAARAQNFQTIDPDSLVLDEAERPYSVLPQIALRGTWPDRLFGLTYSFDGELAYFDRRSGVIGWRLDALPEIRMPLRRPGIYVEPAAAWRHTSYDLSRVAEDGEESPRRSAPIVSVDGGMVLERNLGRYGRYLQTLEPRLLYLYVPYREQADLPVFGTTAADLSLVQLFRTNRYIGPDRLSDANQVSIGVTSRLIDTAAGEQLLSATLGQIVHFQQPRVTLPGEAPPASGTAGPIAEVSLRAHRHWSADFALQWDSAAARTERSDLQIRYARDRDRIVNLGYRQLERESIRQLDGSVAWPLGRSLSAFGRVVYSLADRQTIDQFAGFEYRSCCWRVRLVARHYLRNRLGETDTSVLLQLELNGLSNLGFGAAQFLEESIRGYSAHPLP